MKKTKAEQVNGEKSWGDGKGKYLTHRSEKRKKKKGEEGLMQRRRRSVYVGTRKGGKGGQGTQLKKKLL